MTDQPHTPNDELVAKVRAIAIDLDGDYRNGSWNEGAAKLFDQMIIQVEAAAEQRGAARGWDAFVDMLEDLRADWKKPVIEIYPNPYRADQEGAQDE